MVAVILAMAFVLSTVILPAQDMALYRQQSHAFWSAALGDSLTLDLMLPRSLDVSSPDRRLPVLVIMDSHNRQTFAHHLAAVEILTYHSQTPELLVVGIPFREDNRYLLTGTRPYGSEGREGLTVLGAFLFDELLPWLEAEHRAGSPRVLAGHSRTAYAVSALLLRHPGQVRAAGAFSGFFEPAFHPSQARELAQVAGNSGTPLQYYFSAGRHSPEETTYLSHCRQLRDSLQALGPGIPLRWNFREHDYAGHMANYTLSLPWMLTDYFGPYSLLLTEGLFGKVPDGRGLTEAFARLEKTYGPGLQPELVHYYSFANAQAHAGHTCQAVALMDEAIRHYPGEVDLYYLAALWSLELGREPQAMAWIRRGLAQLDDNTALAPEEREEARREFKALLE